MAKYFLGFFVSIFILFSGCLEGELEICQSNSDCGADSVCSLGECITQECSVDSDCPENYTCHRGECANLGCRSNSDCADGEQCVNGECKTQSCIPSQEICDGLDNNCNGVADELCGTACENDSDCMRGQECVNGLCDSPRECTEEICDGIDNDCDGQIDENCGAICQSDYDCLNGEVCVNNHCVPKLGCETNQDCRSGEICIDNVCVFECICPEVYSPVCGVDGRTYENLCVIECEGVEIAHPGECLSDECYTNEDCPEGTICIRPACDDGERCGDLPGFCEPAQECFSDYHCAPGESCIDGVCQIETCGCPEYYDPVCGADGKTYSNECFAACENIEIAYFGECEELYCWDDSDCPEGMGCFFWDYSETGICYKQECEPVDCLLACEYGFKVDENGCEICECNEPMPECISDRDCPDGMRCEFVDSCYEDPNGAVTCIDSGYCVENNEGCFSDRDCPEGMVCQFHEECFETSDGDVECAISETGYCTGGIVEECDYNGDGISDCVDGEICNDGVCEPIELCGCPYLYEPVCGVDNVTYPNSCIAECENRVEIAYWGECEGERCFENSDCLDGMVCKFQEECYDDPNGNVTCITTETGYCVYEECGEEICFDGLDNDCDGEIDENCEEGCRTDYDCFNGQVCLDGFCQDEEICECYHLYEPVCGTDGVTYGNSCYANCHNVEIAYWGECEFNYCSSDDECGADQHCEFVDCLDPSLDCYGGGICVDNDPVDPSYCITNSDCPSGMICELLDGCYLDENGEINCVESGYCVDAPEVGCDVDGDGYQDCAEGETCSDGECIPLTENGDCQTDADCPAGFQCAPVDGCYIDDSGEIVCLEGLYCVQ